MNLSLTGTALKDELASKIISTHTRFLSYSEIWDSSKITDLDPFDATQSTVILIYGYDDNDGNYITDRTRNKDANGGNAGTDWNREHSYAKSLGTPDLGTAGPGSDAHHLRPADVTFNGQRSSKKFASGGGHAGDSNGGWYPGDEWKGDIARMMMYMYIRYGNQCLPTNVGIGSSGNTPDDMIDLFLQWNAEDPVSQLEINRNEYHGNANNTFAQGNRNPFIDNPAFATEIWGGPQAEDRFGNGGTTDTQAPSIPSNLTAANTTQTTTDLSWTASTDNIAVTAYDIFKDGLSYASTSNTSLTVTGLTASTTYNFTVKAKDAAGNISNASNTATVTTLANSGGGSNGNDLFLSEYVEGSSNNKALEIANSTGSAIDLAAYSIKRNTNGGTSWGTPLNLSGQLANGSVFVIANSSSTTAILNVADLTSGGDAVLFNGNDPVGLFKNDVLIDIIGNFNGGSANFAADVTLRRNASVTRASTTYNTSEWDSYPIDTFDGLGNHTTSGGGTGSISEIILQHSFETGLDGWTEDGSDSYRIRSSRSYDGNYSFRIRDNSGIQSAMTSSAYDISGYNNLTISFNFYSNSMETGEDFWFLYFDGNIWQTVKTFVSGRDFNNDEFTEATVTISSSEYTFPVNAQFRFQCDASSNSDDIYIDNVIVTASTGTITKSKYNTVSNRQAVPDYNADFFEIEDLQFHPNPAQYSTIVRAAIDIKEQPIDVSVKLVNLQGKIIKTYTYKNVTTEFFQQTIDVSGLENGLYFVNFSSSNGLNLTKKLVVK